MSLEQSEEAFLVLAQKAIELDRELSDCSKKLDTVKNELRQLANGDKKTIVVAGSGTVSIATPRKGGVLTGEKLEIDTKLLETLTEFKNKLIEKNIIRVVEVFSTPAAASITIKSNV